METHRRNHMQKSYAIVTPSQNAYDGNNLVMEKKNKKWL